MRFISIFAATFALLASAVLAQNATEVTGNPLGASYLATLPDLTSTNIRGSVLASSNPNGTGVIFQVSLSGFPDEGGPFLYHIHVNPITDGNFTTAGGHLDPFLRGESPSCAADLPETCQVGDLSGKHGKVNGTSYAGNYVDSYVSTQPGTPAFLGNRSIIVHFANKTIITGANFVVAINGTSATSTSNGTTSSSTGSSSSGSTSLASSTTSSGSSNTATGTTATSPAESTGGADKTVVGAGVLVLGLLALFL